MFALALRIYYGWQNKLRDAAEKKEQERGEVKEVANIEWLNCASLPFILERVLCFSDLEMQ
jgi:hypothetical protein